MMGALPIREFRARVADVIGRGLLIAVLGAGWLLVGGCQAPPVKGDIRSDAPVEKIPGIVDTADNLTASDYHRLVTALDNDDPAVRMFAGEALYRITGERKGYRYYDDAEQRRAAVDRWRQWEREEFGTATADAAATGEGVEQETVVEEEVVTEEPADTGDADEVEPASLDDAEQDTTVAKAPPTTDAQ